MTLVRSRRGFLLGLASLIAAPALVKADSLMQIKGVSLFQNCIDYTVTGFGIDGEELIETIKIPLNLDGRYDTQVIEILRPKFTLVKSIQFNNVDSIRGPVKGPQEDLAFKNYSLNDPRNPAFIGPFSEPELAGVQTSDTIQSYIRFTND